MFSALINDVIERYEARIIWGYPRWLRLFLARDVVAITLGRTVYVTEEYRSRPQETIEALIRHELMHVRQVAELGLARFLFRYLREFVASLLAGTAAGPAYENISFEVEARRAETDCAVFLALTAAALPAAGAAASGNGAQP